MIAFNGYIALFVDPFDWIPSIISRVKRAQISYERLDKIFELETERVNEAKMLPSNRLQGDIVINNLSFTYPNLDKQVLKNIDLKIEKGKMIGIIGKIGSGKTTLMNLLTRLYSVPNGVIKIAGKDINEIPVDVLRNNICYISQDNFIFSSTIKDNVRLFRENYEEKDILDSVKKAIVYDDIEKMPDGIDTVLGEKGSGLSGGQKQRVCISRAFLKNSEILIFDDVFSALDNKTSEKLLENVRELAKNKICIVISNKVSDVKNSDKIIVLSDGKIIESGTHGELLENNGAYQEFYNQQSKKAECSILV